MSLDIYLTSRQTCPSCGHQFGMDENATVHQQNITHNLAAMATEANLYDILWYPEANGIIVAGQLIKPLERAIAEMKADPPRFEKFNSPNGWGLYRNFLPWLEELLVACRANQGSAVVASR